MTTASSTTSALSNSTSLLAAGSVPPVCQEVVHHQRALGLGQGIGMYLHNVVAVLQCVLLLQRGVEQLSLLAYRYQGQLH